MLGGGRKLGVLKEDFVANKIEWGIQYGCTNRAS